MYWICQNFHVLNYEHKIFICNKGLLFFWFVYETDQPVVVGLHPKSYSGEDLNFRKDNPSVQQNNFCEDNTTNFGQNLFVKNIADSIDGERLRSIFGRYGTITSAKVCFKFTD